MTLNHSVHNILDNINYAGEDKIVLTVLQFLKSSKRPLPARYCNGDFMIPNNPLSNNEQYELAGNAVMAMGMVENKEFAEKVAGGKYKAIILYLGESISLIVGFVKKLGGSEENMTEIMDLLHKTTRKLYNENELPQKVIDISEDYFKYCYNFVFNTIMTPGEVLEKVYNIISASSRPMPAYFTGNGDREKSFCVDFKELTADDEYEMASFVYREPCEIIKDFQSLENILEGKDASDKMIYPTIVRFGEDIILGAYILTKLGHEELSDNLSEIIQEKVAENYSINGLKNVDQLLNNTEVREYFKACIMAGNKYAKREPVKSLYLRN